MQATRDWPQRSQTDGDSSGGPSDLRALFGVLRRSAWIIVLAVAVAAGGTYFISKAQTKRYSTSASVLLRAPSVLPSDLADVSNTPERAAATNFELASQGIIERQTARKLVAQGHLGAAVAVGGIQLKTEGDSDLLKISATAHDPAAAALAANAFAAQYLQFRRSADQEQVLRAQALVDSQARRLTKTRARLTPGGPTYKQVTAQIKALRRRSTDLTTTAALQTGNAQIVEQAVSPTKASSPKPKRDALIGAFGGLLLGLALALGRHQLDRRLRNAEEVETLFGFPLLARIPESPALAKRTGMPQDLPPIEAEAFRMLRANLRYATGGPGRNVRSLLVTSAVIEDGKSVVSFYLAAIAAAAGARVLLIEADIRRPALGRKLGLPRREGLATLLEGSPATLKTYAHQVPIASHTNGRTHMRSMDVLLAGDTRLGAAELLEAPRMRELLQIAETEYDFVVVDTPPAGVVSDAIPLMSLVGAVLVVARVGRLTTEEADRLRDQLARVDAPIAGVVANFTSLADGGYYAYGYDGRGRAFAPSAI